MPHLCPRGGVTCTVGSRGDARECSDTRHAQVCVFGGLGNGKRGGASTAASSAKAKGRGRGGEVKPTSQDSRVHRQGVYSSTSLAGTASHVSPYPALPDICFHGRKVPGCRQLHPHVPHPAERPTKNKKPKNAQRTRPQAVCPNWRCGREGGTPLAPVRHHPGHQWLAQTDVDDGAARCRRRALGWSSCRMQAQRSVTSV